MRRQSWEATHNNSNKKEGEGDDEGGNSGGVITGGAGELEERTRATHCPDLPQGKSSMFHPPLLLPLLHLMSLQHPIL